MVAFFIVVVVAGFLLYIIPMEARIKQFAVIVAIIVFLVWLLQLLGLLGSLSNAGPK